MPDLLLAGWLPFPTQPCCWTKNLEVADINIYGYYLGLVAQNKVFHSKTFLAVYYIYSIKQRENLGHWGTIIKVSVYVYDAGDQKKCKKSRRLQHP